MRRSPTARLFVAVDPPAEVRERLIAWARAAVRGAGGHTGRASPVRLLDPELLHVTLCFLGARPVEEIDSLGAQLATCAGPAGELSTGAPLWLPARRPRALAVELRDERDRLARLQRDVVTALEEVSGWQPNGAARRRFHPHITVARMGRDATDRRSKGSPIGRRERVLPPTPALSFVPTELVLYRSWLSPEGASYEAVASHPVG